MRHVYKLFDGPEVRPTGESATMDNFTPTAEEEQTLLFHIVDWRQRSPIQRAVCLSVLRGLQFVPQIAEKLEIPVPVVETAARRLLGQGLRRDNGRLLFH